MSPGSSRALSLLRAHVADALLAHAAPVIQADLVRRIARPGYALHPEGPCRAGVLALEVYGAVRGRCGRPALLAAAAVELYMQAAYIFDDVADRPCDGEPAEDLALAIALLTAGTAAAVDATTHTPHPSAAMRHFCGATSAASAGQFLDASLERRGGATLDEAHRATRLKSGSLGKFAAGFAARVAGTEPGVLEVLEQLGFNIFTFAQIIDDHRDACPPGAPSDLARGKATLPVAFYRRRSQPDSPMPADDTTSPGIFQAYNSSGAPAYAAIVACAYLDRAHADLQLLAGRGYSVEGLKRFLEVVESGSIANLDAVGCGVVA